MSRIRVIPALLLTLVLMTTGVLSATAQDATPSPMQNATPPAAQVVPPGTEAMGASYSDWAKNWWEWSLSFPTVVNPGVDETGAACGLGQHGDVFFLAASTFANAGLIRTCMIPEGMAILVPVIGADCSTAEADPNHGSDATSLSACAKALVDQITAAMLNVDGTDITLLESYRVQTPVFSVILPEGNWLNAPAGSASVVADGVYVLIEPMSVGSHTISFGGTFPTGGSLVVTYNITVEAPSVPAG